MLLRSSKATWDTSEVGPAVGPKQPRSSDAAIKKSRVGGSVISDLGQLGNLQVRIQSKLGKMNDEAADDLKMQWLRNCSDAAGSIEREMTGEPGQYIAGLGSPFASTYRVLVLSTANVVPVVLRAKVQVSANYKASKAS
ncbi:MAG: hypothetical protein M1812_000174 [Candelaria pacifica]|nr:MAG: hypothetical protein M1812_000174 [Candelaria pacifica]